MDHEMEAGFMWPTGTALGNSAPVTFLYSYMKRVDFWPGELSNWVLQCPTFLTFGMVKKTAQFLSSLDCC